jgi:hypothetical protein
LSKYSITAAFSHILFYAVLICNFYHYFSMTLQFIFYGNMNLAALASTVNLKIILKEPNNIKPMNNQTILALMALYSGENSLFSQIISVGSDA